MMKIEQYLLVKLAEEASEIAQIALKTAQFGVHEKYHKLDEDNLERISGEFNDLLGVIELLRDNNVYINTNFDKIADKKIKVKKYLKYSQDLGMVEQGSV